MERSITADRLIDELDRITAERGYPTVLRCDNGPEPACAAMRDRAGERIGLAFIPSGQPWHNGYIESFNGRTNSRGPVTERDNRRAGLSQSYDVTLQPTPGHVA